MSTKTLRSQVSLLALLAAAACGSADHPGVTPDAAVTADAGDAAVTADTPDTAVTADATVAADAGAADAGDDAAADAGDDAAADARAAATPLAFPTVTHLPVGTRPVAVLVRDLDGDGRSDIAVLDAGYFVTLWMAPGPGGSWQRAEVPFTVTWEGDQPRPTALTSGDFDGDGKLDLAIGTYAGRTYGWESETVFLRGDGAGHFTAGQYISHWLDATHDWDWAQMVVAADFDHDGTDEIASGINDLSLATRQVWVSTCNGTTCQALSNNSLDFPIPSGIVAVDLDGDGNPDIATSSQYGTVSVLLGHGDGSFARHVDYGGVGLNDSQIYSADFDGNRAPDLIVLGAGIGQVGCTTRVGVLLGNGDGTFQTTRITCMGARPSNPQRIAVTDLDGDGHPDIAADGSATGSFLFLRGRGDGFFEPQQVVALPSGAPHSFTPGDVDGDGRSDLVGLDRQTGDVLVYRNGSL